jgi:dihydrodipicolinate reductase
MLRWTDAHRQNVHGTLAATALRLAQVAQNARSQEEQREQEEQQAEQEEQEVEFVAWRRSSTVKNMQAILDIR